MQGYSNKMERNETVVKVNDKATVDGAGEVQKKKISEKRISSHPPNTPPMEPNKRTHKTKIEKEPLRFWAFLKFNKILAMRDWNVGRFFKKMHCL